MKIGGLIEATWELHRRRGPPMRPPCRTAVLTASGTSNTLFPRRGEPCASQSCMPSNGPTNDAESRSLNKRWLENGQRVGPILDAERWERLSAMTDEEAQRVTAWVLDLWQPDWTGDAGEGLLLCQRVFAAAGPRRPAR